MGLAQYAVRASAVLFLALHAHVQVDAKYGNAKAKDDGSVCAEHDDCNSGCCWTEVPSIDWHPTINGPCCVPKAFICPGELCFTTDGCDCLRGDCIAGRCPACANNGDCPEDKPTCCLHGKCARILADCESTPPPLSYTFDDNFV